MNDENRIDFFKNDVRYREKIAHIQTLPAKNASYKTIPDTLEEARSLAEKSDFVKGILGWT